MNKQQWMLATILLLTVSLARAQTVEYIHTDALGSPVAVTNASGAVIERTVYEPYGAVINRPVTNGPGYTGHVLDAVTGLNYMQQRYYDPQLGRFLSNDPVTATNERANFNRYWYAENNPYKFTDPDGRNSVAVGIGAGFLACSRIPACARAVGSLVAAGAGAVAGYFNQTSDGGSGGGVVPAGDAPAQPAPTSQSGTVDSDDGKKESKQRNKPPGPLDEAEGRPHSIPDQNGGYTTHGHNGPGTWKQYRPSGQAHGKGQGGVPRPNVKEAGTNVDNEGNVHPDKGRVRPPREDEAR